MPLMQEETSSATLRLTLVSVLIVGIFAALFMRLWFLQVLAGERYQELAERNRVQWVVNEAPRGRLLDHEGRALVKNRPALTVSADKRQLLDGAGRPDGPQAEAVLDRLSHLLEMSREEILEQLNNRKYSPFRPVPVKVDVPPEVVLRIQERQELYPGVVAETLPVRVYPYGSLAAHVVGYTGEINENELASERYQDYRLGDKIGKAGLEYAYEHDLDGVEGLRKLEVNAQGAVQDVLDERVPVPGNDLVTTLDLDVQRDVESILAQGLEAARKIRRTDGQAVPAPAGAAVVLDVKTGGVVAMASFPSYDPTVFLGGISTEDWGYLNAEENHKPLLNRAIVAEHPPGSIFKPVPAAAAMKAGIISPDSHLSCPGSITIGRTWRNWTPRNEGSMDVARSLMRSCDTFYYQIGNRMFLEDDQRESRGEEPLELVQAAAREFGLGDPTGIDLPAERDGSIPGRAYKKELTEAVRNVDCDAPEPDWECSWRYYDAINQSIGQGLVTTTPLQMAVAYAAMANGGTVWEPHLGKEIRSPDGELIRTVEPEAAGQLELTPAQLRELQVGLEMVVLEPRGTANGAFVGFPLEELPVAGKTGTAESNGKVPFAWFASYAPITDPKYAVVVMVEEGSGGSTGAAPIVRRIYESLFDVERTPFPLLVRDPGE
ncbi:MAG: penicillin-binding protein 2 [Actinobacteria bacterium]|nr:penicillin-binding protein 2 [Actinomycetota bacterium]